MTGDIDPEKLKGIDEDVPFAWEQANTLERALEAMAEAVEGMAPWNSEAEHARVDWHGRACDVFDQRVGQCNRDAGELARALRDAVTDLQALRRAAQQEQDRRDKARKWREAYEKNQAKESGFNQFTDWVFGEDFRAPPEPEYPEPPPNLTPAPGAAAGER